MDHSRVIDVIRSERFTLVEIREDNRLQLVNTVHILMNFLSSYSSWIIAWFTRFGNVKSATDNPKKTHRVLESHRQLTAEISVTLTVLDALEQAILRLH